MNADPPPETSSTGDSTATGSSGEGEGYLGGLVGIVLGGAAGLLILSTTSATVVSLTLIVTAFSAGIALKGISDAAASPPANQTGTGKTNGDNEQAQ